MPSKICSVCGLECGVITKECSCGEKFPIKVKLKRELKDKSIDVNWRELKKGEVIKSVNGYGPWRENEDGSKTYMGEYGKIIVDTLDGRGIHGYNEDGSHCYIFMGKDYLSPSGTNMSAHNIKKIV